MFKSKGILHGNSIVDIMNATGLVYNFRPYFRFSAGVYRCACKFYPKDYKSYKDKRLPQDIAFTSVLRLQITFCNLAAARNVYYLSDSKTVLLNIRPYSYTHIKLSFYLLQLSFWGSRRQPGSLLSLEPGHTQQSVAKMHML